MTINHVIIDLSNRGDDDMKKVAQSKDLKVTIEFKDGNKMVFTKSTKWTIDRLMSHYRNRCEDWYSIEVKVV
jgi:hypothetical protein